MSSSRAEIAGRLSLAVGALNRRIRAADSQMSVGLISALATIADHDRLRPGDVAKIEGVAAPSATRMIAELERRGLVARETDPDDGRAVLLHATAAGAKALAAARRERAERLLALVEEHEIAVPAETLAVVVEVLEGLLAHDGSSAGERAVLNADQQLREARRRV